MGAIYLAISHCTEDDVAAADIVGEDGSLLVAKDTCLSRYIIERLGKLGITYIRIYDDKTDCIEQRDIKCIKHNINYKDSVLYIKEIINSISCGEKLDYNKVIDVAELIYSSVKGYSYIMKCMAEIRSSDEYTYVHSVNTAFYSMMIGTWLGLNECDIRKLILAGLLHDIGKTKIPKHILNKEGKLTSEEFEQIKNHTIYGYAMLSEIDSLDLEVKRAVLMHHERIDRSGYPFNTSPDKVGLYARIVAIADVFDAMTSERVYKKRSTPFAAFEMFKSIGVGCFDTRALNAFLNNIPKYYIGSNVLLSNGIKGEIVYVPPHDILNPVVKTDSGYVDLSLEGSPQIV